MNKCDKCSTEAHLHWSDWSDRYLCEQCEEIENREMMNEVNPSALWMPEDEGTGLVLSKVNGWVRRDDEYKVYVDGSEEPFIIEEDDYPSFVAAFKAYWS